MTISEDALAEACKKGDRESMKLLYCTYSHYLLGVINRYLSDLDSSKDLLQDSFLLIFDRIDKFKYRGEGSLKAWLTRVVINESLMFLRHSKKMGCCSFDDVIAVDLELEEGEPEESFLDSLSYGDFDGSNRSASSWI